MLPPHEHEADAPAREAPGMLQQRREPRRAGAFGHRLLDLEQRHAPRLDGLLLHDQHVVDQLADDRQGESRRRPSPRCPRRWSSPPHSTGHAREALVHRRVVPRLHADDADRGLERLGRGRDARDQAAAADRHHDERRGRAPRRASRAPTVPCPAITGGSSYGWTNARPSRARPARARACRPRQVLALEHDAWRRSAACSRSSCSACRAASRSWRGCRAGAAW